MLGTWVYPSEIITDHLCSVFYALSKGVIFMVSARKKFFRVGWYDSFFCLWLCTLYLNESFLYTWLWGSFMNKSEYNTENYDIQNEFFKTLVGKYRWINVRKVSYIVHLLHHSNGVAYYWIRSKTILPNSYSTKRQKPFVNSSIEYRLSVKFSNKKNLIYSTF